MLSRRSVRMPGSSAWIARKLRSMRPAPVSNIAVKANWVTTNSPPMRPWPGGFDQIRRRRSAFAGSVRDFLRAGTRPDSSQVTNERPRANDTTLRLRSASSNRSKPAGARAGRSRIPAKAVTNPRNPERADNTTLSETIAKIILRRSAPRAARMANSCSRLDPRAKSKCATLEQAMSNRKIVAASSIVSERGASFPASWLKSGTTRTRVSR